jgi:hypothetical protein
MRTLRPFAKTGFRHRVYASAGAYACLLGGRVKLNRVALHPATVPKKLGHQHAAFPLPEGDVSLSFPAEMSVVSAQMMASFVKLLLEQAERQAKARESAKNDEAAN